MPKPLSFNQWIKTQTEKFPVLAETWASTRGRLTRSSVEKRAQAMGVSVGGIAWDEYQKTLEPQLSLPYDDGDTL